MLSTIIDSKSQTAIVSFLIAAPARSFGAKELAARLGVSAQALARDLGVLAHEGIIRHFQKNGERFYLLNRKQSLVKSLQESMGKGYKYEDELFAAIKKLGLVKAAFLSGFFTGHPELPVDLLLVGKISLTKLDNFLKSCRKALGVEVNYSVMSEDEFVLRRDTFDRFIKDVFDYPHLVIVDTLSKKGKK
jgi:DNA-binding Lrp family transcriptional regulator